MCGERLGELRRARDAVVFLLLNPLAYGLLHLLRHFGEDVRLVELLQDAVKDLGARGGVDSHIGLLSALLRCGCLQTQREGQGDKGNDTPDTSHLWVLLYLSGFSTRLNCRAVNDRRMAWPLCSEIRNRLCYIARRDCVIRNQQIPPNPNSDHEENHRRHGRPYRSWQDFARQSSDGG